MNTNVAMWSKWVMAPGPLQCPPEPFAEIGGTFHELMLLKVLRDDKLLLALNAFVARRLCACCVYTYLYVFIIHTYMHTYMMLLTVLFEDKLLNVLIAFVACRLCAYTYIYMYVCTYV